MQTINGTSAQRHAGRRVASGALVLLAILGLAVPAGLAQARGSHPGQRRHRGTAVHRAPGRRHRAAATVALTNPGFEAPYAAVDSSSSTITGQIAAGWSDNSAWADVTASYAQDTSDPRSGSSDQKVTVTAVQSGSFQMLQSFDATAGMLYRPGMWFRGTPGTVVDLVLQGPAPDYAILADDPVDLTDAWRFVTLPVHVTVTEPVDFIVQASAPTTFYVDDASIGASPGPITPEIDTHPGLDAFGMHIGNYLASRGPFNLSLAGPFVPVDSTEATITGTIGQWWSDNSDWADVTADYEPDRVSPHGGHVAQRIVVSRIASGDVQVVQPADLTEGESYTASVWLRATAGMQVGFGLRQSPSPYTSYAQDNVTGNAQWQQITVSGTVTGSGQTLLMVFAYTPGTLDFDDATLVDAGGQAPSGLPWPATPFGTWRLWDQAGTTWAAIEPDRGVWNFAQLDDAVAAAQAHQTRILLTLGQTPTWASSNPTLFSDYGQGASAPPTSLAAWVTYIRTVATRYRGEIFDYELWNEPNDSQYYTGSIAELVTLTRLASEALRSVDPSDQLISAAPYNVGWLDQYLAAGAARWVDAVGYHIYDYEAAPESDVTILADLRTVMADNHIAAKPLWITEGAVGDTTTTDPDLAAGLLARKYLVELLYGAQLFDWYAWGPATSFCLATTGGDFITPTPAGAALGYLESWIAHATMQDVQTLADGTWQVTLTTAAGAPAYIIWNPTADTVWSPPSGFDPQSLSDLFGDTSTLDASSAITASAEPQLITG